MLNTLHLTIYGYYHDVLLGTTDLAALAASVDKKEQRQKEKEAAAKQQPTDNNDGAKAASAAAGDDDVIEILDDDGDEDSDAGPIKPEHLPATATPAAAATVTQAPHRPAAASKPAHTAAVIPGVVTVTAPASSSSSSAVKPVEASSLLMQHDASTRFAPQGLVPGPLQPNAASAALVRAAAATAAAAIYGNGSTAPAIAVPVTTAPSSSAGNRPHPSNSAAAAVPASAPAAQQPKSSFLDLLRSTDAFAITMGQQQQQQSSAAAGGNTNNSSARALTISVSGVSGSGPGRPSGGGSGSAVMSVVPIGSPPKAVHGVLRWLLNSNNTIEGCLQSAAMGLGLRPRILVTAPSNTAIDGIVLKIVKEGMRGAALAPPELPKPPPPQAGAQPPPPPPPQQQQPSSKPKLETYRPPLLRVGEGASPEVRAAGVHLEAQVEEILSRPPDQLQQWRAKLEADSAAILADITRQREAYHAELGRMRASLTSQAVAHAQREAAAAAAHAAASASTDGSKSAEPPIKPDPLAAPASNIGASSTGAAAAPSQPPQPPPGHIVLPPAVLASLQASIDKHAKEIFSRVAGRLLAAVHAYDRTRQKASRCEAALGLYHVPERDRAGQFAEARRHIRNSLLEGAEIVLTTTSSAAVGTVETFITDTGHGFDIVVIDEAAQAVEPSSLIPLRYGCSQCILVGDPQQLPATVISRAAARSGYDKSLFARMVEAGLPYTMLDTQYRCHPAISAFPSRHFYGGRLKDDVSVIGYGRYNALHESRCFRPLVFFNLYKARQSGVESSSLPALSGSSNSSFNSSSGGFQRQPQQRGKKGDNNNNSVLGGLSSSNVCEAEFLIALLRALNAWRGVDPRNGQRQKFTGTVGVITFYRAQLGLLRDMIEAHFVLKQPGAAPGPAAGAGGGGGQQASTGAAVSGSATTPDDGPAAATAVTGSSSSSSSKPTLNFILDINTVDGFQGQERDVILLSCVRTIDRDEPAPPTTSEAGSGTSQALADAASPSAAASTRSAIGFLDDPRRMNVALTRAKYGCWVIGHGPALHTSTHWRAFLEHCAGRGCVMPVPNHRADPTKL